ncbi:hypothetical protein ACNKHW_14255 [Shigella flexneri]
MSITGKLWVLPVDAEDQIMMITDAGRWSYHGPEVSIVVRNSQV